MSRVACFAALCCAPLAHAEQQLGTYIAPQLGITQVKIDDPVVGGTWRLATFGGAVGYQANRILAFEFGYTNVQKLRLTIEDGATYDLTQKVSALNASALTMLPMDDRWSLFL